MPPKRELLKEKYAVFSAAMKKASGQNVRFSIMGNDGRHQIIEWGVDNARARDVVDRMCSEIGPEFVWTMNYSREYLVYRIGKSTFKMPEPPPETQPADELEVDTEPTVD